MRKMSLDISEMMVGAIYAESMMTIIDTITDQTKPNQMKYVEFLVFLCRIAHEHYQNFKKGAYQAEKLYKKLDRLMAAFLEAQHLAPTFLFGDKFDLDEKKDFKKYKLKK